MTRREFFQLMLPGLHGKPEISEEQACESLQDLFLQAMEKGLDPASYTPEALRGMLAEHPLKKQG